MGDELWCDCQNQSYTKVQRFSPIFIGWCEVCLNIIMAIAPITGALRRKIITDITIGFGCGFVLAELYWYFEHKPIVAKREAFYAQLKAQKEAEDAA